MFDDPTKEKIEEFREIHRGEVGARVLADTFMELGMLDIAKDDRQRILKDHAVQVIAKMGVISPGDKLRVLEDFSRILQQFSREETDGR